MLREVGRCRKKLYPRSWSDGLVLPHCRTGHVPGSENLFGKKKSSATGLFAPLFRLGSKGAVAERGSEANESVQLRFHQTTVLQKHPTC